jgi:lipid-binding SYLF domain-containing protein
MLRVILATALAAAIAVPARAADPDDIKRIAKSAEVLSEIRSVPDKAIPNDLWENASCVVVIPDLKKAAFVFGGEYGRGLMSCRKSGEWTAPAFMRLHKGSWGLQIGAQETDLVLLVMNDKGMEKLLNNKVSLGAEASVAAGPVGRDARAATDAQLTAEILSYSRAQGLFAGVNLSGGVLQVDEEDNAELYGKAITARQVLGGAVPAPPGAEPLMAALGRK